MSLNNVVQFPKSSTSRRRVPMSARIRNGFDLTTNLALTMIALLALGVLGVVGWVYGVCQNRTLSGMPRVDAATASGHDGTSLTDSDQLGFRDQS